MKYASFLFSGILAIAVVILFIMQFSGGKSSVESNSVPDSLQTDSVIPMKYASVNVDSLLKNYDYYKELESKMLEKQKTMEAELQRKMAAFEKEATEFQKKVQANAFLSMESAQRQEQELYEKQQNLMKWKDDVSVQLATESQQLEQQLLDTVNVFLEEFNKKEKYEIIFNSAAFLHGGKHLDITDTIVQLLNIRYKELVKPE